MSSQPKAPPRIFSANRKLARKQRASAMADAGETAWFLVETMSEDLFDRLGFLRHEPSRVLVEGLGGSTFALPVTSSTYDLVASVSSLGTVNDLPGALIQMRELLVPGGLAMASFVGGTSLPCLRQAMFAAEPERPAARMHPLIDPRSCPELLSRAGWKDPVVDSYRLTVRYSTLQRLVQDLREMAMGSVLASPAPALTRAGYLRAQEAFAAMADDDGKVSETFEIITITGRR